MKSLILSMVIYVLLTINAYCGSNYYIIVNDSSFDDISSFDARINSLEGGSVISSRQMNLYAICPKMMPPKY